TSGPFATDGPVYATAPVVSEPILAPTEPFITASAALDPIAPAASRSSTSEDTSLGFLDLTMPEGMALGAVTQQDSVISVGTQLTPGLSLDPAGKTGDVIVIDLKS